MAKKKEVKVAIRRQVNLYLDAFSVREIDKLANKIGISRSRLARNLLLVGLDQAKMYDAFGLFTFVRTMEIKFGRGLGEGELQQLAF